MSLVRVSTTKQVRPKIAAQTTPSQYPIKWFQDHAGCKPPLNITLTSESLSKVRGCLKKEIVSDNVELGTALTFLYYFPEGIKEKPEDEWRSYDVRICEASVEMTPLDLFEVTKTIVLDNKVADGADTAADDPWMAGYALSVYRILRGTNTTYSAKLADRIKNHLAGLTDATVDYTDAGDKYRGWLSNKNYNKLVAGFDMFYHRFPESQYSSLRICTTGSRHRDCAGLLSYGYLADVLGVKRSTDIMDWVFLESIANDIDRIMEGEDELTESYSYFPYQVDMCLVEKSSYSATINPCFFEWAHLIGSLMGSTRSQNAKHITDKQSADIFANAACVAYVYSNNFEFTKAYTESGEEFTIDQDLDEDSDDTETILRSKDATDWLTVIKTHQGNLPEKVKAYVRHGSKSIKDPRLGTINDHLQKKANLM